MRRLTIISGGLVLISLLLASRGILVLEVFRELAFGWLAYVARVLPDMRIAWDGVATGLLCLALFAFGLHRTLRWLHGEIQKARGVAAEEQRSWSPRWSAALVALIVLMFIVGIAATGIVHQTGWLIVSRRSLVEQRVGSQSGWGTSVDHLKYIGLAAPMLGMVPETSPSSEPQPNKEIVHSWMTEILPGTTFIVGGQLREDLPWNDPRNSAYFKGLVPIYLNPEVAAIRSPEGYALSHYAGNVHVLGRDRTAHKVRQDGAAHTILAGEVAEGFKPWGDPSNLRDPGLGVNQVPGGFGGPSGTGANLLFVDGSVRFFRETTSRDVLRRLSLPGAGDH
jgi:prepilin-type processing-associated H-X9-DG protein